VALTLGVVTFALRMLALVGFPNDQFMSLTPAAQMLLGEWPVRDFVDAGAPLTIAASALALGIGGRNLLSEAVLVSLAFAVAAVLMVVTVRRWTGSVALAVWAAIAMLVAYPRPYSYPKIVLYVAAAGAMLAYAERPGRWRRLALAGTIAVAFLFRHDHGLYIAVASCVALAFVHARDGCAATARACIHLAGMALVVLTPFIVFVQVYAGWPGYLATALEVSRVEAARTLQGWPDPTAFSPGDPDQYAAVLYYVFWALAALALALIALRARTAPIAELAVAAAAVVLAVCVNAGFLRDPIDARIPDAVVPAVLLLAWIAATPVARGPAREFSRLAIVATLALMVVALARVGRFGEQVDRAGVNGGIDGVRARALEIVSELRAPYVEEQMPSDFAFALVPFYRYVQACTPSQARLFVTGFAPEVAFYARRGFAGGHAVLYAGFHSSPPAQQQIVDRLDGQLVPFVIVPPDRFGEFERLYPGVHAYVARHYRRLTDVPVDGAQEPAHIFVRRDTPSVRSYGPEEWPCFR
jgi:hypothetical protein